jgi:hypothetical protein
MRAAAEEFADARRRRLVDAAPTADPDDPVVQSCSSAERRRYGDADPVYLRTPA